MVSLRVAELVKQQLNPSTGNESALADWDSKFFTAFERLLTQEVASIKTSPETRVLSNTYAPLVKFLKAMAKKKSKQESKNEATAAGAIISISTSV